MYTYKNSRLELSQGVSCSFKNINFSSLYVNFYKIWVNAVFFTIPGAELSEFDSWLTVGLTDGDVSGALRSAGIDFSSWDEDTPLTANDGAVFWLVPDDGPGHLSSGGSVVVAQITVRTGSFWTAHLNAGGQSTGGHADWRETGLVPDS